MNYFCLAFPEKGEQWVEGGKHKTAGAMLPHRTIKPMSQRALSVFQDFPNTSKGQGEIPSVGGIVNLNVF